MSVSVRNNIIKWTQKNMGLDFKFRDNQLETIEGIVSNIVNHKGENQIIEAPTGSGKSIICLVSAGVLAAYYKINSYILCSDLFLWKQYENFIDTYKLPFGYLKGVRGGNYICQKTGFDVNVAPCQLQRLGWKHLANKSTDDNEYSCASTCEYVLNRKKASEASVTLLTYQLFLYQRNVMHNSDTFRQRDVIFCDECHKIPSIIQQFFAPEIYPEKDFKIYSEIIQYANTEYGIDVLKDYEFSTIRSYKRYLSEIFDDIWNEEDVTKISESLNEYNKAIDVVKAAAGVIEKDLLTGGRSFKTFSKDELSILSKLDSFWNHNSFFIDFDEAIKTAGKDFIIKNNLENNLTNTRYISLNCAKEDLLVWKMLFSHSSFRVLLSATVGDKENFDANCGIKHTKTKESTLNKIPSSFDFSQSPIFYLPTYKMSYNYIDENLPKVAQLINNTLNYYKNQNGIIHTSSYKNAVDLFNLLSDDNKRRIFLYKDSKDKDNCVENMKYTKDAILCGPTLVEGVDLPEELCRFIIILKVPYPNTQDKLVKKKMEIYPRWYDSETNNSIIQAIGRGNRTPTDWCHTYIVDGCFGSLYLKYQEQYPENFKNRLQVVNI